MILLCRRLYEDIAHHLTGLPETDAQHALTMVILSLIQENVYIRDWTDQLPWW